MTTLANIYIEAGLVPDNPVQPGGAFILNSGTSGVLNTGTLGTYVIWTDISDDVISFTVNRPSTRQQGPLWNFQAGTLSVLLDNSNGDYDPDNLAGPFVSNGVTQLTAMVPVRVRVAFGSINYNVYNGFSDGWFPAEVTYQGEYAELTLAATDAFKVLAGINLPTTTIEGVGADTGARIKDILTRSAWYTSAEKQVIDVGNSNLQGTTLGDNALALMQLAVDSELGQLFVDGTGAVVFRARHALLTDPNSNTVQAVFGDAGGSEGFSGFAHPVSAQLLGHTEPDVKLFGGTYYCYYRNSSDEISLMTSSDGATWAEQGSLVTKGSAGGTFTLSQQTSGSTSGTAQNNTPQITISTTGGHHLVGIFTRSGGLGTGALTSVTDSAGNTWALATRGAVSGLSNTRTEIWYSLNASAVSWVQGNSGTSQTWAWDILDFAGPSSAVIDVVSPDGSASASSSTITTPSITTTGSSDLVIAACHAPFTTASLTTGGFTATSNFDDTSAGLGRAAYKTGATAGSYSVSWSQGLTQQAGVAIVSFKSSGGGGAAWDSNYVISPSVVYDGSTYYLFYEGNDGSHSQIGYATASSPSGPFTKYSSNPVLSNTGTGFEQTTVGTPAVFYKSVSGKFYMYYHGYKSPHDQTGLAWATSPSGTWTRHPLNPVMDVNGAPWMAGKVAPSSVILINGIVYVFLEADPGTGKFAIGVAEIPLTLIESSDLVLSAWNITQPLFSANPSGWDNDYVQLPSIVTDGTSNGYWMFYSGHTTAGAFWLGRATSVYSAGTELSIASVVRASDDTTIVNDVQATRANSSNLQEVQDSASIGKYLFPRTYSRSDLILQSDTDTRNWAQWVLYIGRSGENRIESIKINPLVDPVNLWPQVLGREIGDRIQIWVRPPLVGKPIVKDCFIVGIQHDWVTADSQWTTTWTLQDASKYGSFVTLDNPTLGKLNSNALTF